MTLQSQIKGQVITPADPEYEQARRVWNGMTDKKPRLIVKCQDDSDVVAAVKYAGSERIKVSVSGGGHSVAGSAMVGNGIVIDLSLMRQVTVDKNRKVAQVDGGCRWRDVDRETQKYGLATPGGIVSDTGVGGLTLGGGLGWLRRKYGLSCDNVISAQVVTASGQIKTVSETSDPDLFWALRGGGGGFGVVTEFEFKLHQLGPEVFTLLCIYPVEAAKEGLPFFEEQVKNAPNELSSFAIFWTVAHAPTFPTDIQGKDCFILAAVYAGDPKTGENLLTPLRKLTTPLIDLSGVMPYVELQKMFDEDYPVGGRYYWMSVYFDNLSQVADVLIRSGRNRASKKTSLDIWHLGGAIAQVKESETAYGNRQAKYLLGIEANWVVAKDDAANIAWARATYREMRKYTTGQQYLNFPGFLEEKLEHITPSEIVSKLSQVKAAYDPSGLFV